MGFGSLSLRLVLKEHSLVPAKRGEDSGGHSFPGASPAWFGDLSLSLLGNDMEPLHT